MPIDSMEPLELLSDVLEIIDQVFVDQRVIVKPHREEILQMAAEMRHVVSLLL